MDIFGLKVPKRRKRQYITVSHFSYIKCPTIAVITLLQKRKKKEHLNPFSWGDLVAGHYIEDGTRWIGREEGGYTTPNSLEHLE